MAYSDTSIIRDSMEHKIDVRLQRLADYPVLLSTVKHGDCPSECSQIRENVGLKRCRITEVSLYSHHITILKYVKNHSIIQQPPNPSPLKSH